MSHTVDHLGRPVDPVLRKLEDELQILSRVFRGMRGNPEKQEEIAQEYQKVLEQLYELGWDGSLDLQSELPSKYMPERYLQQNPP
jgi:hypothetical protein